MEDMAKIPAENSIVIFADKNIFNFVAFWLDYNCCWIQTRKIVIKQIKLNQTKSA